MTFTTNDPSASVSLDDVVVAYKNGAPVRIPRFVRLRSTAG